MDPQTIALGAVIVLVVVLAAVAMRRHRGKEGFASKMSLSSSPDDVAGTFIMLKRADPFEAGQVFDVSLGAPLSITQTGAGTYGATSNRTTLTIDTNNGTWSQSSDHWAPEVAGAKGQAGIYHAGNIRVLDLSGTQFLRISADPKLAVPGPWVKQIGNSASSLPRSLSEGAQVVGPGATIDRFSSDKYYQYMWYDKLDMFIVVPKSAMGSRGPTQVFVSAPGLA